MLTKAKEKAGQGKDAIVKWFTKNRSVWATIANVATVLAFTAGLIALAALIWLYVRPIKVADIKVPVATDQASYYPGEEISGIFFGEIFHKGEVRVLREVFCKDYKNIIEPPASARNGDFYDTQSIPRKIEGLSVTIGNLPRDIPVGSNCVLQFTNVYNIQTPFGIRHIEYQYYTQNFSIVTRERRMQLECEAAGKQNCNFIIDVPKAEKTDDSEPQASQQFSPESAPMPVEQPVTNNFNDNRRTTNNTTNNPPAEPVTPPQEVCTVNLLGIKAFCRTE